MQRPICSPRTENVIDFAQHLIQSGWVEVSLTQRFQDTLALEPQRGQVDLGMGLCGAQGRRLADSMGRISCSDCLALLRPAQRKHEFAG